MRKLCDKKVMIVTVCIVPRKDHHSVSSPDDARMSMIGLSSVRLFLLLRCTSFSSRVIRSLSFEFSACERQKSFCARSKADPRMETAKSAFPAPQLPFSLTASGLRHTRTKLSVRFSEFVICHAAPSARATLMRAFVHS